VHLDVQVPTRLDARQEELLRELAKLRGEERVASSGRAAGGLFGRKRR
jgi:molecular chaperone DnaJ